MNADMQGFHILVRVIRRAARKMVKQEQLLLIYRSTLKAIAAMGPGSKAASKALDALNSGVKLEKEIRHETQSNRIEETEQHDDEKEGG